MTLIEKWKIAAVDLNLDIVSPFVLILSSGITIKAQLLLKNFGAPKGMIIFNGEDNKNIDEQSWEEINKLGYGYSILSEPRNDSIYDQESFKDMLNEWGWTSCEKDKPEWINAEWYDAEEEND